MFYWISYTLVHILLRLFFGLKITGSENIPKKGAFILAGNHISHIDPPLLAVSIKRKLCFLTKAELFENRFFGLMLRHLNCVPLERDGVGKSALRIGLKTLRRNGALLIFPEGTRSRDGNIGTAKNGISLFAIDTDTPVIPAFVKGTDKALPPGAKAIKISPVSVVFGKAVYPPRPDRQNRKEQYQNFANRIMDEIVKLGENED